MRANIVSLGAALVEQAWHVNERFATELSSTNLVGFRQLVATCSTALAVVRDDRLLGFALALDERAQYESDNYQWFRTRFKTFYYIDRIAVLPDWQSKGLGKRLYRCISSEAIARGQRRLCCEYNIAPANYASERFHDRMGFQAVGARTYPDGVRSVSMQLLDLQAKAQDATLASWAHS